MPLRNDIPGYAVRWICDLCGRQGSGPYWEILRCDKLGDPTTNLVVCSQKCGRSKWIARQNKKIIAAIQRDDAIWGRINDHAFVPDDLPDQGYPSYTCAVCGKRKAKHADAPTAPEEAQ